MIYTRYKDKQLKNASELIKSVLTENDSQLKKWGIQSATLSEWLLWLTEEVGELAQAIGEKIYRVGTDSDIYSEAIQVSTLSLKIAELVL